MFPIANKTVEEKEEFFYTSLLRFQLVNFWSAVMLIEMQNRVEMVETQLSFKHQHRGKFNQRTFHIRTTNKAAHLVAPPDLSCVKCFWKEADGQQADQLLWISVGLLAKPSTATARSGHWCYRRWWRDKDLNSKQIFIQFYVSFVWQGKIHSVYK